MAPEPARNSALLEAGTKSEKAITHSTRLSSQKSKPQQATLTAFGSFQRGLFPEKNEPPSLLFFLLAAKSQKVRLSPSEFNSFKLIDMEESSET